MPAARAASSRLIPSEALASANRRLLTRPSRSRRASARSSAGVRPVAIGTATMASAPGLLSLPSQLAGRCRRARLSVAGIRGVIRACLDAAKAATSGRVGSTVEVQFVEALLAEEERAAAAIDLEIML